LPGREGRWVRFKALLPADKSAIAARCDRFIAETLKPRFLPTIRVAEFNYAIDIFGKWRGDKYSFITRWRSGHAHNLGDERDSAFTRLDYLEESVAETRFDIMWHRHTGQWFRLFEAVTLDEALRLMESEELLWPTT
jgi:hypothetical protein